MSAFVVAQKLILHRVLAASGRQLSTPFTLDPVSIPKDSTDPAVVQGLIDAAVAQAIRRSGDYETAFLLTPNQSLLFQEPATSDEIAECEVGAVWAKLLQAIDLASWAAISHNLIGFLYEAIVDADYRHALGQHYTQENVVDLITTFSVPNKTSTVLDPAAGGGSFLRSAYGRKRDLQATHVDALAEVWGCEISSFAAELSTVTLATADATAPSSYPRVVITDFFDLRPGQATSLEIPGAGAPLQVPLEFDAVVGNPPYISYRHQTNQERVLKALSDLPHEITLPKLSGKSDEYAWFLIHATRFLKEGGRLGFIVSSGVLFADYGIPLIRFLARHHRVRAVIDSMVERWFTDADTNTVILLLERESDADLRSDTDIRFIRLRRPLSQLLPAPLTAERRGALEDLVDDLLDSAGGDTDPRYTSVLVKQGQNGGLTFDPQPSDPAVIRIGEDDDLEDEDAAE